MTKDQGRALWSAALSVPAGALILEIGSHQGRSTVVLGTAAKSVGATVVAVDPFVEGRLFGGAATRDKFETNVRAAGVEDVVRLEAHRSTDLRPGWREPLGMLYIDGKHDYWTVRDDLKWTSLLPAGAPVLVDDSPSSIGVKLGSAARPAGFDAALPRPRRLAGALPGGPAVRRRPAADRA